jgi:phospholipid/cholesterol/gamma-HCH transport system ATP-binding protein
MEKRDDAALGIVMEAIHKSFGAERVLQGLSLEIKAGERVAVLGRSGSGKSVLLKLLVGLEAPDSGAIRIGDEPITAVSSERLNDLRRRVGFLFQDAALFDSITIHENVAFPLERQRRIGADHSGERVQQLLTAVGLGADAGKLPAQLSGGMKKRAGIARALALDPSLLLFDEPTAGLDPVTADEIAELIVAIRKDRPTTSVVVTHDLRTARAMADRFVLLEGGTCVVDGTFDELQSSTVPSVAEYMKHGR